PKIAPALQVHAEELKRAKLETTLAHKIENRPPVSELIDHNILHDTSVAPSLQGKQAELARSQLEDRLNTMIQERSKPEALVEKHILGKRRSSLSLVFSTAGNPLVLLKSMANSR
ncbi:hypothetical protein BGW38_007958, partial [Lunasporangiospora selenospora]